MVVISIDGLNPEALRRLGRDGAPAVWSLIDDGAATLDARAEVELTDTLPNHTGMLTGRPVLPENGGHGVVWNDDLPGRTVQQAAGEPTFSALTSVHDAGGTTAVFAGKTKFGLFEASWPVALDLLEIDDNMARLAETAADDLRREHRDLTFVHLDEPDVTGHASGWLRPPYLDAVREADDAVARVLAAVRDTAALRSSTLIVLTSDHGGADRGHGDVTDPANFTVPFVLAGPGVPRGDLYDLSPRLADPGDAQPAWDAAPQPVRNCDVANVITRALGLPTVPGSRCLAAEEMPLGR